MRDLCVLFVGTNKSIIVVMNELTLIRSWLCGKRGQWARIASDAGLSSKTVQRIARGEVTSVSLRTYVLLRDAMLAQQQETA